MALRKPLVVVNGQVQEVSAADAVSVATQPANTSTSAAASTEFVMTAVGGAGGGVPPGGVIWFAANAPPTGFLKANGGAVSRTTYSALFAAIGTTFGAGDGSTTFALPDLRGRFVRAWDDGAGVDAGRTFGSVQADQNLSHTHTGSTASAGGHSHTVPTTVENAGANAGGGQKRPADGSTSTSTAGDHVHTVTVVASGGTEARPKNIALLPCIKF